MFIIKHRNIFFAITGGIVLAAVAAFLVLGLRLGIEFASGIEVHIHYAGERPSQEILSTSLDQSGLKGYSLLQSGTSDYLLRSNNVSDTVQKAFAKTFSLNNQFPVTFDPPKQVLPSLSADLRTKALVALGSVLFAILIFIAFAFRKVSQPVSSWTYGLIALVTLVHDIIVPAGFYAALGHFTGSEVDTLFVTALLTILGFSIHDTIVVFDRVRENLRVNQEKGRREDFAETAGRSLNQTFVRSINTSLTVLITLLALFFLGPASTKDFALTLLVGIIAGTYSSIFLATPLLVTTERWFANRK